MFSSVPPACLLGPADLGASAYRGCSHLSQVHSGSLPLHPAIAPAEGGLILLEGLQLSDLSVGPTGCTSSAGAAATAATIGMPASCNVTGFPRTDVPCSEAKVTSYRKFSFLGSSDSHGTVHECGALAGISKPCILICCGPPNPFPYPPSPRIDSPSQTPW